MKLTFTQVKKLVRKTIKEAIEGSNLYQSQPAPTVPVFGGGVEVESIFDQEKKEFLRRAKTTEELGGNKNKYAEQLYAMGIAKKNNDPTILRPYKEKIVDLQRMPESKWINWLSAEWPDFEHNDWMAIAKEIFPNVHDSFIHTQRLERKKQKTEKLRQATEKNKAR